MGKVDTEAVAFVVVQGYFHMVDGGLNAGTTLCLSYFVTLHWHIQQIEPELDFPIVIRRVHDIQHIIIQLILQLSKYTHIVILDALLNDPGVDLPTGHQQVGSWLDVVSPSRVAVEHLVSWLVL